MSNTDNATPSGEGDQDESDTAHQSADSLSWNAIRQQCPRCETFKASIEFTSNSRFGILCRPCMDELPKRQQDTRQRQQQQDEKPRERVDGQPVGSPPPEMI